MTAIDKDRRPVLGIYKFAQKKSPSELELYWGLSDLPVLVGMVLEQPSKLTTVTIENVRQATLLTAPE
jgi:hypothetical protein